MIGVALASIATKLGIKKCIKDAKRKEEELKQKEQEKLKKTKNEMDLKAYNISIKLSYIIEEFQIKKSVYGSIHKEAKGIITNTDEGLEKTIQKYSDIHILKTTPMLNANETEKDFISEIRELEKKIESINKDIFILEIGILLIENRILSMFGLGSSFVKKDIKLLEEGKNRIKEFIEKNKLKNRDTMEEQFDREIKRIKEAEDGKTP